MSDEDPVPGRWRRVRPHYFDSSLTQEQRDELERLSTLAYVSGSKAPTERVGVTLCQLEKTFDGFNLILSGHRASADLLDMQGNIVHQWAKDFEDVWPDYPGREGAVAAEYWRKAAIDRNGDLIVIFAGFGVIKVDKDSNLLWATPIGAHHDLQLMPNGDIYVLTRVARLIPKYSEERPVLEHFVSVLSPDGEEVERFSILDAFENSPRFKSQVGARLTQHGEVLHMNSIRVMDGRLAERIPAFRRGNVLLSSRVLHLVVVMDLTENRIVWGSRGDFRNQHDAQILATGNLLLFDNGPWTNTSSSILELDPETKRVQWRYHGTEENPFWSRTCGTVQRLPNGNTLITESDAGRAFEITPDKEIVWEFLSPYRAGENDEFVATLFDVARLAPDSPTDWLGEAE